MRGGRVLMIAHHFPPAGGSGSNRALAFARYLPAFGWRPTVLTAGVEWAVNRDDRLLTEIPSHVRIVRTRSLERLPLERGERAPTAKPASTESAVEIGRVRRNLGHVRRFPDAHIGWLPFAIGAARREPFDVAYSSSGPFTSHVVGMVLKRLRHRPWVAELRDGWYRWNRAIFPDYPAWRDVLESGLEAAAIRSADRVVLVTERMAAAFRQQYTELPADHFGVVSNGFDPLQFRSEVAAAPPVADRWVLLHTGALYYGRSLALFLAAARSLVECDANFGRNFRLRLVGTLDGAARAEVAQSGLTEHIELVGQMPHADAIEAMRNADALLLVANTTPGAEATVPGKLFEYLAVGRPVLAVAPAESATADVLRSTSGGWLAAASDPESIVSALQRAYRERHAPPVPTGLGAFDRRRLTRDLAAILDGARGLGCRA